jgi:FemAB-related protein (PEP-CTERM system-associated)
MITANICEDPVRWDAFVDSMPEASNYHRWIWRNTIDATFGHKSYYFEASEGGTVRGVLPLVWIRSRIFGNSLVSMPFSSYGGILADTPEAREQLLAEAVHLARSLAVNHIELRQTGTVDTGWQESTSKVTMEIPLPPNADAFWKTLSPNLRHNIKRSRSRGLEVTWAGAEAVHEFYHIFAENMRNLGSPVYPCKWFENICSDHEVRILIIRDQGNCVAAGFLTPFRDVVELPWSASTLESRKKYSHVLLFWSVMEWAMQNGYKAVDLGRCTPGGGTYEFKRHWPCIEKPLHWCYWLAPGRKLPELRPESPRYALAIRAWKRLPVAVANTLGPRIVRGIP